MKNYKIKDGIVLPLKKCFPGYGFVTITADISDAQVGAILATGHGDKYFEAVEQVAVPVANDPEENITEEKTESQPKPSKKNGKARKK